jgi:uncharacterized damage-inducible protein DinB
VYLLPGLVRYNAWANRAVLDAFATNPAVLDVAGYDGAPLLDRLKHQHGTERSFLDVLRGTPKWPEVPSALDAIVAYASETSSAMLEVLEELGEAAQERPFLVPWFRQEFPMHVLVTQALGHSAQHRSELAWELARAGVDTGNLDLIGWIAGGEPSPGEKPKFPER